MNHDANGPRHRPADLRNPEHADDALLHWDDQDEQLLRMLALDPERGQRLRKLQDADRWLRDRAADKARQGPGPGLLLDCPPAEELYDFGQGPGAGLLASGRRDQIDRHLATCLDCERFVTSLRVPPPPPLIVGEPDPDVDGMPELVARLARPAPALRRVPLVRARRAWIGVAAAAAVLVVAVGVWRSTRETLRLPEAPLLRGSSSLPLYFPRESVLLADAELTRAYPALDGTLVFEIEPLPDATEYRVDLARHAGGVFATETPVRSWTSPTPRLDAREPLSAGHYTWTAWAVVRGLDQRLGRRDFEVRADPALAARLLALAGELADESSAARLAAAVRVLHAQGFWTDARKLARGLPTGEERDRYLSEPPGR